MACLRRSVAYARLWKIRRMGNKRTWRNAVATSLKENGLAGDRVGTHGVEELGAPLGPLRVIIKLTRIRTMYVYTRSIVMGHHLRLVELQITISRHH